MHIEKNVCESILGTLLALDKKNKDNVKSQLDLQEMNIRHALHPIVMGNKTNLPCGCFSLKKKEKIDMFKPLKGIRAPDGYASNISRCISIST